MTETEGSAHLCVNQSIFGSTPRFRLEKHPKDAPPPIPTTKGISKGTRVEDKEIRNSNSKPCLASIGGVASGAISASSRSSLAVFRKPLLKQ